MAARLTSYYGDNINIEIYSPLAVRLTSYYGDNISIEILGMYPEICNNYLEYEGSLQLLVNGLVDISIVHWCEMYLYELPNIEYIILDTPALIPSLSPVWSVIQILLTFKDIYSLYTKNIVTNHTFLHHF